MKKLDKRYKDTDDIVAFEEEQRRRLSSNNVSVRCSSLDLISNNKASEKELIKYLANILIEGFLWHYEHAGKQQQISCDILPGFDQRAS